MCVYPDVLGGGAVLQAQALVLLSIAASIAFWVWMYGRQGVGLRRYAIPIMLWIVFGTLDIMITVRGTFDDPYREGNPLARFIFVQSGPAGPVLSSILWIALWSGIVLLINKRFAGPKNGEREKIAVAFVSLAIFYSVAAGHMFGFSSWFMPLCPLARIAPGLTSHFMIAVVAGSCAAAVHTGAMRVLKAGG